MNQPKYDPTLLASVPQEIIDAAEKVRKYFELRNAKNWVLSGIQSAEMPSNENSPVPPSASKGKVYGVSFDTKSRPGYITATMVHIYQDTVDLDEKVNVALADDPLYRNLQAYVRSNPRGGAR